MPDRDFGNRRTDDFAKLFGLAVSDIKTFVILILMFACGYLWHRNDRINEARLIDKEEAYKEMVQEIRRQVPKEVTSQLEPIKDTVNSVSKEIKSKISNDEKNK